MSQVQCVVYTMPLWENEARTRSLPTHYYWRRLGMLAQNPRTPQSVPEVAPLLGLGKRGDVVGIMTKNIIQRLEPAKRLHEKLTAAVSLVEINKLVDRCCEYYQSSFQTMYLDEDKIYFCDDVELEEAVVKNLRKEEARIVDHLLCALRTFEPSEVDVYETLFQSEIGMPLLIDIEILFMNGETMTIDDYNFARPGGTGALKLQIQKLCKCPANKQVHMSLNVPGSPNERIYMREVGDESLLTAVRRYGSLEPYNIRGDKIQERLCILMVIVPFQRKNTRYERSLRTGGRKLRAYNMSRVEQWDSGEEVGL